MTSTGYARNICQNMRCRLKMRWQNLRRRKISCRSWKWTRTEIRLQRQSSSHSFCRRTGKFGQICQDQRMICWRWSGIWIMIIWDLWKTEKGWSSRRKNCLERKMSWNHFLRWKWMFIKHCSISTCRYGSDAFRLTITDVLKNIWPTVWMPYFWRLEKTKVLSMAVT